MTDAPIGVLVMAYGTANGPGDIERYYTDIRGGRAPTPEHLRELKDRYSAIGNVFPLLDTTRAQAAGIVDRLNAAADGEGATSFRAYLGMKHSPPFIPEAVARMRDDGVRRGVGIVMAPHWSGMSVETYVERAIQAADDGAGQDLTFVRKVKSSLPSSRATVIFSAHSLPVRTLDDATKRCRTCDCADSCRYVDALQETADLVTGRLGIGGYEIAWQSAGRTNEPWWGPPVEDVIEQAAARGRAAAVVCSAGFVADNLEILYDLDIEAREIAERAGMRFERTEMPNADPAFLDVLASVVSEHLAEVHPG